MLNQAQMWDLLIKKKERKKKRYQSLIPKQSTLISSSFTYIATSRDMFDIVLGAAARRDMAEVQLFVHYLNLKTVRETHRRARKG